MSLNRRQFISGTALAVIAAGCDEKEKEQPSPQAAQPPSSGPSATRATNPASAAAEPIVEAGPASNYASDQVYDAFRDDGFFVIRREGKLFALSSICPHRGCKVRAQPDTSFTCKCHGSNFAPDGKVLNGPATRDLPRLKVATDRGGNLLIKLA